MVDAMRSKYHLIGKTFGRLTVIGFAGRSNVGEYLWRCHCLCGKDTTVKSQKLRLGYTKSCGCLKVEMRRYIRIHGMRKSREYQTWIGMKARCSNPHSGYFKNYGGRGIKVCDRWLKDFPNFFSDLGPRPEGYSLDRIDSNGNYEPSNCRWASIKTQQRNKRSNQLITHD